MLWPGGLSTSASAPPPAGARAIAVAPFFRIFGVDAGVILLGRLEDLVFFGKLECMGDQFVRVFSRKVYLCNT